MWTNIDKIVLSKFMVVQYKFIVAFSKEVSISNSQ